MMISHVICIVLVVLSTTKACPTPIEFNEDLIPGKWYLLQQYGSDLASTMCTTFQMTSGSNQFNANVTGKDVENNNKVDISFELKKTATKGKYELYKQGTKIPLDYTFLVANSNVCVLAGCTTLSQNQKQIIIMVLSKTKVLTSQEVESVKVALTREQVDSTLLTKTDHDEKKCAESGSVINYPSIIIGMIMILSTKIF